MQERHRSRFDRSVPRGKTTALDQIVPFPQLIEKPWNLRKIVAVVGVSHNNEPAAGRRDSAHECVAVTSFGNGDHAGAQLLGDLNGAVGAAVVCHNDLSFDLMLTK